MSTGTPRWIMHLDVEAISIDEAFLDVSGLGYLVGHPQTIGRQIKAAIRAAVGLTASVGIAPNRLVAKIASDFGKPDGLVGVTPDQVLDFLGGQSVGVLRGVGRRALSLLEWLGLRTVADLRGLSLPITARRVVSFRPGQKLKARVEANIGAAPPHANGGGPANCSLRPKHASGQRPRRFFM